MVTCSNCGNTEPEGARFCGSCGSPFAAPAHEPEATPVAAPLPPSSGGGRHRLRWFAIGAVLALLLVGGVAAAVFVLGDDSEATVASSGDTVSSESDCAALHPVLTHLGIAADPASSEDWIVYAYGPDRDFLDDFESRAPEEVRADVARLRDFLDRYESAAQAAGAASGTIPELDQQQEIEAALNLSSDEEDDLRTSIQLLLTWAFDGCVGGSAPADTTTSGAQTVSEADCIALGSVIADLTIGAHADDLVPTAYDISPSDYLNDRDFLDGYSDRAPAELRADVLRFALFIDRYAAAAQAVGLEPGGVPTPEQVTEIRATSHLGNVEQDQLPGSIEALRLWSANGCGGDRPLTETTPDPSLFPTTTDADPTEPAPVELSDEEVTELVNEALSRRTEAEFLSSPLGSEVRDCRKDYDISPSSLLAPGGVAYVCEVWFEGELWSDAGHAALDADGSVYVAP